MRVLAFLSLFVLVSCDARTDRKADAVARVHNEFLSESELVGVVPAGTSKKDSALMVKRFIENWATRQLMLRNADVNLSNDRKAELDALVDQYRGDLYARAYLEELVKREVDTLVAEEDLKKYYDANKNNFRANGVLVRLRYLQVPADHPKLGALRSRFFDFRKSDKKFWDTYTMQLKSYAFNDSVWVDAAQVYGRVPVINPDNRDRMLVPGKSTEQVAGNDVWLIKVKNAIYPGQVAPYEYVKPTLNEIIINNRKLALIRKYESEITTDARKANDYEVYK